MTTHWLQATLASTAALLSVAAPALSPEIQLTATPALIMGGTGMPTPPQPYLDAAISDYIVPALGGTYDAVATYTPEEGLGTLPGETMTIQESARAGVAFLEAEMANYPNQPVVVFGYSQSGAVGILVKKKLAAYADAHPDAPVPDVTFVLLGCDCRPNGSLTYRLGDSFDDSVIDPRSPIDTPFETVDVAKQYDFTSDWPLYPLNVLAVANVVLGGFYVHTDFLPVPSNGGQSTSLDGLRRVSAPGVDTTYYLIPTEDLPLYGPLRSVGVPEPLIDVVEPVTRATVELGYDRSIPPWEPTPFRLVPDIDPFGAVDAVTDLVDAAVQGVANAVDVFDSTTQTATARKARGANRDDDQTARDTVNGRHARDRAPVASSAPDTATDDDMAGTTSDSSDATEPGA